MNEIRLEKYPCKHAKKTGEGFVCVIGLCEDGALRECCPTCAIYSGTDRGLGDTVKRVTNAVGIKTCGACEERRKKLNSITEMFYGKR